LNFIVELRFESLNFDDEMRLLVETM